jgi:DNA-binding NtrC family response regulator
MDADDPSRDLRERLSAQFVAESAAMQSVRTAVAEAAESDGPLLIEGEAGVGKEYIARLVHSRGRRAHCPFETLLSPSLPLDFASEHLLGLQARKLRFAARGTLLLKDVWRFPPVVQSNLAQAIGMQSAGDRTPIEVFDVRLMMSSRVELESASRDGLVLQPPASGTAASGDPSPWLHVRRIAVPPLRRRPADIPRLAELVGQEIARVLGREPLQFSPRILDRFVRYPWPGNLSELKAVVYRLVSSVSGPSLEEPHLEGLLPQVEDEIPIGRFGLEDLVRAKLRSFLDRIRGYHVEDLHSQILGQVERPLIELALEHTRGNQLQAARVLGINRNTLRKRIMALGIRVPR